MFLAICFLPAGHAHAEECGINQNTLDQRAVDLAKRHPGGRLDNRHRLVSWRLQGGDVLSVQHAGCMDLVTEIRVTFGSGKAPSESAAIARLLSAVKSRWDGAHADAIARQMSEAALVRTQVGAGAVELTSSRPDESSYKVRLTEQFAAVSWLDG
ncbi:hypothetical protein CR105_03335 [Massilia eurypsychrophila]|uniref:Uncharacterized protein n=1 Tax=Massilia eurypsychrophila TaxID=1485217 RepID=A0A2G8TJA5_9BURK|nr:hypothetical protein CR105_03335 [Massilia eurypsychrophila]